MRRTLTWVWDMIFNPPIVWTDANTGEVSHSEKVGRFRGDFTRWSIRPMWFHTIFTIRYDCGCRKRFGIWPTIWCMKHSGIDLGEDA